MKFNILIFTFASLLSISAMANVIGSDAQNFNPTTNGLDFVTVHSSETLEPGYINLGIFVNHAVNTLPYFPGNDSATSQSRTSFNDSFTAADYNAGYGIMKNWDIGVSFPVLLAQSVDNTDNIGLYKEGSTEIRINTKYRLSGDNSGGTAVIGTININRIENNPFAGEGAGPTLNLEFAADTTYKKWAIAGNVGYRKRSPGDKIDDIAIDPMPDQFIASTAASYLLSDLDTKLILEAFFSWPNGASGENQTDRELSSSEFLVGLKHTYTHALALHAGAGTELSQGASSPDWRFYAGLNYSIGPEQDVESIQTEEFDEYERLLLPDIFFKFDKAELAERSKSAMEQIVQKLTYVISKSKRIDKLLVEGHTDSIGSEEYNMDLSQRRANTVADILRTRLKVPKDRVFGIGYGETKPIADNGNYQGRQKNRRVEIKLFRVK